MASLAFRMADLRGGDGKHWGGAPPTEIAGLATHKRRKAVLAAELLLLAAACAASQPLVATTEPIFELPSAGLRACGSGKQCGVVPWASRTQPVGWGRSAAVVGGASEHSCAVPSNAGWPPVQIGPPRGRKGLLTEATTPQRGRERSFAPVGAWQWGPQERRTACLFAGGPRPEAIAVGTGWSLELHPLRRAQDWGATPRVATSHHSRASWWQQSIARHPPDVLSERKRVPASSC